VATFGSGAGGLAKFWQVSWRVGAGVHRYADRRMDARAIEAHAQERCRRRSGQQDHAHRVGRAAATRGVQCRGVHRRGGLIGDQPTTAKDADRPRMSGGGGS